MADMKIYISGPITGRSLGEAVERFCWMESKIALAGNIPVNPIRITPWGLQWSEFMAIAKFLIKGRRIDAVIMLEGWRDSFGARLEWIWAQGKGIPVFYESEDDRREMAKYASAA